MAELEDNLKLDYSSSDAESDEIERIFDEEFTHKLMTTTPGPQLGRQRRWQSCPDSRLRSCPGVTHEVLFG
jgi:hypothetical protein